MRLRITTIIENNPANNALLCNEHGLSLYIETDGTNILFDTGQSGNFIENAEKLNVNLNTVDYVVLSHGHYDHTGGFTKLVKKVGPSFKLIVGDKFFCRRYHMDADRNYKYIGNSFDEKYIHDNKIPMKCITEDIYKISENIMVFSNFQRHTNFEKANKKFYFMQEGKYEEDTFSNEIALGIRLKEGLFVILGCSHIGVVNILQTIMQKTGLPIYGIVGGTHLIKADQLRIDKTSDFFRENNIRMIGLSHCTGDEAVNRLKQDFKDEFVYNNTGNIIEIV